MAETPDQSLQDARSKIEQARAAIREKYNDGFGKPYLDFSEFVDPSNEVEAGAQIPILKWGSTKDIRDQGIVLLKPTELKTIEDITNLINPIGNSFDPLDAGNIELSDLSHLEQRDIDGDGISDTAVIDTNGDNRLDASMHDTNNDGKIDTIVQETTTAEGNIVYTTNRDINNDNVADQVIHEITDASGNTTTIVQSDTNGDQQINSESIFTHNEDLNSQSSYHTADTDFDGDPDAVILEQTHTDGTTSTYHGTDSNNDQNIDLESFQTTDQAGVSSSTTILEDKDFDGYSETKHTKYKDGFKEIEVDTNKDGVYDLNHWIESGSNGGEHIRMDSDSNGIPDTHAVKDAHGNVEVHKDYNEDGAPDETYNYDATTNTETISRDTNGDQIHDTHHTKNVDGRDITAHDGNADGIIDVEIAHDSNTGVTTIHENTTENDHLDTRHTITPDNSITTDRDIDQDGHFETNGQPHKFNASSGFGTGVGTTLWNVSSGSAWGGSVGNEDGNHIGLEVGVVESTGSVVALVGHNGVEVGFDTSTGAYLYKNEAELDINEHLRVKTSGFAGARVRSTAGLFIQPQNGDYFATVGGDAFVGAEQRGTFEWGRKDTGTVSVFAAGRYGAGANADATLGIHNGHFKAHYDAGITYGAGGHAGFDLDIPFDDAQRGAAYGWDFGQSYGGAVLGGPGEVVGAGVGGIVGAGYGAAVDVTQFVGGLFH